MFRLLLKSSSEALLKSSSGAFPILSGLGLAFRVTAVIRSGYLATQAAQKAMPLARAILPTPTTPLVVSKTLPAVNAESTKVSIVVGFLVLGIFMGAFPIFRMRRGGSSGRSPGNLLPGQGLPTTFPNDDLSDRTSSSAGAPPPPPPNLETETVPEPRGKSWLLWIILLALVISLGVAVVIARHLWYDQVKPSIMQFTERAGGWAYQWIWQWVGQWICVSMLSVLCTASVEILLPSLLWIASKIKNLPYRWLVAMRSLLLQAKNEVQLAAFTIFIIAQVIVIGCLCCWLGSPDWLDSLTSNEHLGPYISDIYISLIGTYLIAETCLALFTSTYTIVRLYLSSSFSVVLTSPYLLGRGCICC